MLQEHECGAPVDVETPMRVNVEGRMDMQEGHTLQDFAAASSRALHGFLSSLVTGDRCADDPYSIQWSRVMSPWWWLVCGQIPLEDNAFLTVLIDFVSCVFRSVSAGWVVTALRSSRRLGCTVLRASVGTVSIQPRT